MSSIMVNVCSCKFWVISQGYLQEINVKSTYLPHYCSIKSPLSSGVWGSGMQLTSAWHGVLPSPPLPPPPPKKRKTNKQRDSCPQGGKRPNEAACPFPFRSYYHLLLPHFQNFIPCLLIIIIYNKLLKSDCSFKKTFNLQIKPLWELPLETHRFSF